MTDEEKSLDWLRYEENRIRHSEIFDKQIETLSTRAYEYGILSVKNLMLMSGGALVAMPAIAGMSDSISAADAANSAKFLVAALVLSFVCCYLIHVNWHFNAAIVEHTKNKFDAQISRHYFPDSADDEQDDAFFDRKIAFASKIVGFTYPTPHIAGVAALTCFIVACFSLFSSIEGLNQ